MQHISSSSHQSSALRGSMLDWLSHWGRRLWRSCCFPFQFWPFRGSRPKAGQGSPENSTARNFPHSRTEAIHQGILVPSRDELLLDDLTLDKSVAEAELDLEDALMLLREASMDPSVDSPISALGARAPEKPIGSPTMVKGSRRSKRRVKSVGAEPPFDWVLKNSLAIGALPRTGWEQEFEAQGIHAIISLCDEAEAQLPEAIAQKFCCLRSPLPDSRHRRALTVDELGDAVDLIHWYVQKQQPVYLHCLTGIEQSPLVAIAYLARHRSIDLFDAVGWLSHIHSRSYPIPAQLQVVREYLQTV